MPMLPPRPPLWLRSTAAARCPSLSSCVAIMSFKSGGERRDATKPLGASAEAFDARVSVMRPPGVPAFQVPPRSWRRPPCPPAQFHDVADDFGDRLVVLGRDFLVDLDGGVERARERRVFHDRDGVL